MNVQAQLKTFFKNFDEHSDLSLEENRLATFTKWVFSENDNCSASKLAEAGFYFVGSKNEPDAVICFFCKKSLDSWDPEDDPWAEHLKHAQYCTFAKNGKPQNQYTISDFIDLRNGYILTSVGQKFDNMEKDLETMFTLLKKKCM